MSKPCSRASFLSVVSFDEKRRVLVEEIGLDDTKPCRGALTFMLHD